MVFNAQSYQLYTNLFGILRCQEKSKAGLLSNPPMNTVGLPSVQISARNILRAKVKRIVKGTLNAEVTLAIAPSVELVSVVTRTSPRNWG
jgi:hypothetical protein